MGLPLETSTNQAIPKSPPKRRIRERMFFARPPTQNKHGNASAEGASEKIWAIFGNKL